MTFTLRIAINAQDVMFIWFSDKINKKTQKCKRGQVFSTESLSSYH